MEVKMNKEIISGKQAISILICFFLGSTLMVGASTRANQDSWIAVILAFIAALPILLVYARILKLYPGKNIYDIVLEVFGNFFGKLITLLYVLYSIHLGALVIRNFSEFVTVVAMPQTPQFIIIMFMALVVIYMIKSGIEVFGRWSQFVAPIIVITTIVVTILSIKEMNFSNIMPVFGDDIKQVPDSAFGMFAFPFAESVLFTTLFSSIKPQDNPYKIFIYSAAIGFVIIIIVTIRNILVLGIPLGSSLYFPSYAAIGIIAISDFFSRVEVLIAINLLMLVFVKICVCVFAATMGIAKIFNMKDNKPLSSAVVLLMITLALIIYKSTMEMFAWIDIYKYYAFPFQVILPLIILAGAEIKTRAKKAKENILNAEVLVQIK
jgi:spore germination protein KB